MVRSAAAGLSLTVLAALTTSCGGTVSGPLEPVVAGLTGYRLVWHDEFEIAGLPDETKWDYDTYRNPQWHNNELQYYTARRLENSRIESGSLKITALDEPFSSRSNWGGKQYTSTRLVTRGKAEWTYGHFEIRAKLPCAIGTWPAIWMLGSHTLPAEPNWPASGEIDIMEQRGFNSAEKMKVLGTLHFQDAYAGGGPTVEQSLTSACTDFNTYHMTWTPTEIKIGVNGGVYNTYNKPPNATPNNWPFDNPQYLLLNVAVGGTLGGNTIRDLPSSMEVEFVRVWQLP
jgi:beta-glucanase (GH16 family)